MLFLPAGTLGYWEAWVYMGLLFIPVAIVGVVLIIKDPELLERRMRTWEREAHQRKVIAASSLLLLAVFLIQASIAGTPGRASRLHLCCWPTSL